jgi:hypothetical protein
MLVQKYGPAARKAQRDHSLDEVMDERFTLEFALVELRQ